MSEPRVLGPKVAAVLQAVEDDSLVRFHGIVPETTALTIDAMLWGWWSHRLAHPDTELDEATVRQAFDALVPAAALDLPLHQKENDQA